MKRHEHKHSYNTSAERKGEWKKERWKLRRRRRERKRERQTDRQKRNETKRWEARTLFFFKKLTQTMLELNFTGNIAVWWSKQKHRFSCTMVKSDDHTKYGYMYTVIYHKPYWRCIFLSVTLYITSHSSLDWFCNTPLYEHVPLSHFTLPNQY